MGKMRKREKLVYDVGINDADYATQVNETVGWISNKQKDTLCDMYNRMQSVKNRSSRSRSHVNYCYDSDISDYEAYCSGDYF